MSRPSTRDERRKQIAEALMEVMAERGFAGASITEVARAAKLAPGLVHYHFKDKLDMLLESIKLIGYDLETRVEQAMAEKPTAVARMDAYVDAILALDSTLVGNGTPPSPMVGAWVAIGAEAVREPAVGYAYKRLLEREQQRLVGMVKALLVESKQKGNAQAIAAAIISAIVGYLHVASAADGLVPRGSAALQLKRMIFGMLVGGSVDGGKWIRT